MSDDIPDAELCDRYEQLYTGLVTDVLDDSFHMRNQTLDHDVTPLRDDMIAAGRAFPVVGEKNHDIDPDDHLQEFLTMLGEVPADSMLTIAANTDDSAQIGELTTEALSRQGCRGAVVDGGARDTQYILDQDYPTFARFRTPMDAIWRWGLTDWNVTTFVAGVEVSPRDVVVADLDGVVVVPEAIAEEVLVEAEAMRDDESGVRKAIREGATPVEAYEEYGTF
jgi:regulator of RNase E activity RraA